MKMTPDYNKAFKNMQPGVISAEGFLGDDHRNLADIIEADEESMQKLGLDFKDVCKELRRLEKEARSALGDPKTVDGKYLVRADEAMGKLPSPFEDGVYEKVNITVENTENKCRIMFTELSIHLIEKYHFFEGKGSTYRIEPHDLKQLLL